MKNILLISALFSAQLIFAQQATGSQKLPTAQQRTPQKSTIVKLGDENVSAIKPEQKHHAVKQTLLKTQDITTAPSTTTVPVKLKPTRTGKAKDVKTQKTVSLQ